MKKLRDFKTEATLDTSAAGKYSGLSADELTRELFSKAQEAKQNGTFDYAELERFYTMMSPHLTKDQRDRLQSLLKLMQN